GYRTRCLRRAGGDDGMNSLDGWSQAIARHRAAILDYVQWGLRVEEAAWRSPIAAGKWTPAEITDHLVRTYRKALDEVRGGEGLRPRYGRLLRQALRLTVLPGIFRTRRLPGGATAPSEILPAESRVSQHDALSQLDDLAGEFEREIFSRRGDPGVHLTHHIFGPIKAPAAVDFIAIHTEHHARQLPRNR
ncbi:MAG TPA: DinB family protein, partial [Thermoanaerobaculia bacterium]